MTNIIGGPALRRTDETQINIWIVLDEKADSINAVATRATTGAIVATGSGNGGLCVQLGENLFVYLLKLAPKKGKTIPKDQKLFYDVVIDGEGFKERGLIKKDHGINYPNEPLPSLVIPKKHKHIIQGSCRKPHAKKKSDIVQKDQLIEADALLQKDRNNLDLRPTMLVLTGDQIYADDVATPLLAALTGKGKELMGSYEKMPKRQRKFRSTHPEKIHLHDRDKVLVKREGFTTGAGNNHLMSFGEFISMYLTVWGGIDLDLPEWEEVKSRIPLKNKRILGSSPSKPRYQRVRSINKSAYNKERERAKQFLENTWKGRRLMANVPTYMMFDDHEVTDDWNLNSDIKKALAKTGSLGRRLTTNALAAYWACQGWGNDPEAFKTNFKKAVSDFYSGLDYDNASAAEDVLQDRYWSYKVPGYPALIAIDTRTDRSYASNGAPKLLSKKGFDWLALQLKSFQKKYSSERSRQTFILLSPAPVYGFKSMELIQDKAVAFFRGNDTAVDAEYWSANKATLRALMKALATGAFTDDVIFLSGDVHYSYSVMEHGQGGETLDAKHYFQLTSSATCNHPSGFATGIMKLIEKNIRTPEISYLYAEGQKRVVNADNSVGSLWLKNGLPIKAVCHFHDPDDAKSGSGYDWVYDLKSCNVR